MDQVWAYPGIPWNSLIDPGKIWSQWAHCGSILDKFGQVGTGLDQGRLVSVVAPAALNPPTRLRVTVGVSWEAWFGSCKKWVRVVHLGPGLDQPRNSQEFFNWTHGQPRLKCAKWVEPVPKWDQIGPVWARSVGTGCRLSRSRPSRTIKGDRRSVMGGMAWLGQKMGQGGIKLDHCGLVWEQTGSLWNSVEPFIIKL